MRRWYGNWQTQNHLVKFVVTNLADIREKAYELAVTDARKRAERLARLNGVKLGSVVAVEEVESGGAQQSPYYFYPQNNDDANHEKSELVAESLSSGKITVRLRVRFAIDTPAVAATAATSESTGGTPVSAKGK